MPENRAKLKLLLESLLPQNLYDEEYKSNKKEITFPGLDYQLFNDIITKVSYNSAVSVDIRQELIYALLSHYGINPHSTQSQKRLAQILPSLPSNAGYIEADYDNFNEYLKSTHLSLYNAKVIKYVINKDIVYTLVDEATHKPKLISDDGYQLNTNAVSQFIREQIQHDMAQGLWGDETDVEKLTKLFIRDIPLVQAINHPSMDRITFSESLMIPQYNMAPISLYYERAIAQHELRDTPITRLIHSVMGEHKDFYYHLLAHQVFNPSPPQTVAFIVSHETATGKTTLASALPQALIATARNLEITQIQSGWGDVILSTKWVGLNDLPKLKQQEWDSIYSFIKNVTTGGQRRLVNKKYGGISTVTLPTISMGVSSNYYYPADDTDRRLWVIKPQHLEIDEETHLPLTPKLNEEDADDISEIFEDAPNEYYEDLQDLTNYLLHLYQSNPDKYKRELGKRAPMTSYKRNMIDKHSTYTGRILKSIVEGPRVFNNILDEQYRPFIYKMIVESTANNSTALPYKFLADIIYEVQGEPEGGKKTKLAQVASALDKLEDEFKNRTATHFPYKDHKILGWSQEENIRASSYTYSALIVSIPKHIIQEYKSEIGTSVSQKIDNIQIEGL